MAERPDRRSGSGTKLGSGSDHHADAARDLDVLPGGNHEGGDGGIRRRDVPVGFPGATRGPGVRDRIQRDLDDLRGWSMRPFGVRKSSIFE